MRGAFRNVVSLRGNDRRFFELGILFQEIAYFREQLFGRGFGRFRRHGRSGRIRDGLRFLFRSCCFPVFYMPAQIL